MSRVREAGQGKGAASSPSRSSGRLAELLRAAIGCAVPLRSATYVAGPITGGPRFVAWFVEHGRFLAEGSEEYRAARHKAVVLPNLVQGLDATGAIRKASACPVVEPFSLDIPGWTQDEYRRFWSQVVTDLCVRLVATEGWGLSPGAAQEVCVAFRSGVDVHTFEGRPISLSEAVITVEAGIDTIQRVGCSAGVLMGVLGEMRDLSGAG